MCVHSYTDIHIPALTTHTLTHHHHPPPTHLQPNPTLKAVVALLKLGDWDPDVFYKFRDTILNQVRAGLNG